MFQRLFLFLFLLILKDFQGHSQSHFSEPSDSLNKRRVFSASSGIGLIWTGSIIGLSQIWYKDVNKTNFHTFNDSRNWLQMDKMGHLYTANKISKLSGELYKWGGLSNNKSAFIGAGIGFGYQFTLEMLDAYSDKWGYSWSDVGANTLGSCFYLGQQVAWKEQRILMKFSAHTTEYAQYRPLILGSTLPERLLKDYNGQTYWFSSSPGSFFKNSKFPKWLCFSFGYSIDEKLVGDSEVYTYLNTTSSSLDSRTFSSKRQFLFSLDLDFSQLKIKRKWLKTIVSQFNYLKVPFPTLIIMDGKLSGNWMYF